MQPRLDIQKIAPQVYRAMGGLETLVRNSGLEPGLLELVKMRASQINGCAYCLDMHSKDARAKGETEQRLYALNAWRETPFYTDRERAALAWTESCIRPSAGDTFSCSRNMKRGSVACRSRCMTLVHVSARGRCLFSIWDPLWVLIPSHRTHGAQSLAA